MRDQMQMMNHTDTNLWYVQVVTGFLMFFLGSVHLYVMLTHPGSIDPYLSADRVVSAHMWPLYLILLICVELHATIGLYRLCMKWGWFAGKDARKSRKALKTFKNRATIFFLSVGVLDLLVFVVIGINHRDRVGERYGAHSASLAPVQVQEEISIDQEVLALDEVPELEEVQASEPLLDAPAVHEEPEAPEEVHSADKTHE
jgi:fumarate reductase subunit C